MLYHQYESAAQFLKHWQTEELKTLTAFNAVTEEGKKIQVHPQVRSLEQLAWHIVTIIHELGYSCGLLDNFEKDMPVPETMSAIIAAYRNAHQLLADAVKTRWTDRMLGEEMSMFGKQWIRGTILDLLIGHERHHRSQMTIIMRMAGLRVPGLYGPSAEDWQDMGLPVPQ